MGAHDWTMIEPSREHEVVLRRSRSVHQPEGDQVITTTKNGAQAVEEDGGKQRGPTLERALKEGPWLECFYSPQWFLEGAVGHPKTFTLRLQ